MELPDELNDVVKLNQRETAEREKEMFPDETEDTPPEEQPASGEDLNALMGDDGENETDDEECRKLRTNIMLYLCSHRFRSYLRTAGFNNAFEKKLEKMPKSELEHNFDKIKHLVENRNSGNIYEEMLKSTVAGVESFTNPRLNGLSEDINQDEALLDCLEEIRLKYPNLRISSPEKRLAVLLGMKVFNRYNKNRGSQAQIPQAAQNVVANPQPPQVFPNPAKKKKTDQVGLNQDDMELLGLKMPKSDKAEDPTF